MKPKRPPLPAARNPVAKHAATFCRPATHRDKKKDYQRTPKHRHRDFGVFHARVPEGILALHAHARPFALDAGVRAA